MHRSITLLLAYLNNRLRLDFHHKQVVNKGAHVIVYGETYCYSNLSWGHGIVHSERIQDTCPTRVTTQFPYMTQDVGCRKNHIN